jgi:hypothetical protein
MPSASDSLERDRSATHYGVNFDPVAAGTSNVDRANPATMAR